MKALTNTELVSFCSQLALILRSGISSLEGLSLMSEGLPDGEGKQLLLSVSEELESSGSLYQSLETTKAFPPYMCSMTRIGEHTGHLDDVMEALAAHYQREEDIAVNIKSAVLYPLVMIGIMLIVIAVLIVKVLPVFQQVYELLGAGMTGISGAVLELGNILRSGSTVFFLLFLACAAGGLFLVFTQKGRRAARKFSRHFFITRGLAGKLACSRFARGMYLCLSSGLDIDQSLEMTEQLVEHPAVQKKISELRRLTADGGSFQEAVTGTGLFPGIYARMLSIASRTGATADVMKQISDRYDEEAQERICDILSKLEPALVAILSIAAGLILLSVMLPLIGIMSGLG